MIAPAAGPVAGIAALRIAAPAPGFLTSDSRVSQSPPGGPTP
jgi:hypothetical protein